MPNIGCCLVFRNGLSSSFKVSEVSVHWIQLNSRALASRLRLVIQHCKMSGLGGTLKIIKSNPADKNIQFQKATQFFQNLWEGNLMSLLQKFSLVFPSLLAPFSSLLHSPYLCLPGGSSCSLTAQAPLAACPLPQAHFHPIHLCLPLLFSCPPTPPQQDPSLFSLLISAYDGFPLESISFLKYIL